MIKPRKELESVTPYKPGKPIEEVKRELGLDDVIKLASNENALSPSPKVIAAITEAAKDINRYPDGGSFYLKKAISDKFAIPGENIVLGNGSDEIIILALRAFVGAEEEVIVSDPTFLVYSIASSVIGAKVVSVPAKELRYDLDAMLGAITSRTKMIFIANPDNPTGSYISRKEVEEFIQKVPDSVIVFLDEAYYEFAEETDEPDLVSFIEKKVSNVIIARTFSKAYGLAGLRIGYGFARGDIAKALNTVREPFNINSIAQKAAVAALGDEEYMLKSVDFVNKEKEKMCNKLKNVDVKVVPSKTNFILITTYRDSVEIYKKLLEQGIIVREMSPWGFDGFIRVTMGLEEENEKFLKVFKGLIEKTDRK
ncbi:MAG: histidinol-phosphate transaminase [Candidatus Aadella gelida]|nr:histidinol-phosphate transaminase [Candidatus Aadella gelida]